MDKELLNRLFLISISGLLVAAAIFLCISIFGNDDSTANLTAAVVCVVLANISNLIRQMNNKEK